MNAPLSLDLFRGSKQLHRPDAASTHRVRLCAETAPNMTTVASRWYPHDSIPLLDAEVEFSLFQHPEDPTMQYLSVWVASRGGGRNNDYDHAVLALLERAHLCGGEMFRVAVERRRDTRPIEGRILMHAWGREAKHAREGLPLLADSWRDYCAEASLENIRRTIGRVVALHGRPDGAKGGGNRQKAIRMAFVLWSAKAYPIAGLDGLDTMPGVLQAFRAVPTLPVGGSHV